MKLSNSIDQVSDLKGTTFVFTFKLKTVEGKRKITGLISGMCKKHAKEQAMEIINNLALHMGRVNSIKLVNIQKIDCDFLVVPKEESRYNHAPKNIKDFFEELKKSNGTFPGIISDLFKGVQDEIVRETPLRDTKNSVDDSKKTMRDTEDNN